MESKALVKSTNSNVACKFFARTPSRILRMVSICEVVDLFLRKPFWFFLRMFSILGSDADYADDLALLANTPNQAETLLHSLERAAAGIGLHVNANKTEYMCYNQTGNIATLDGASLKLVNKFTYLGSSVSSTEKDIDTRLTKAWTAIDRLSIIWKSDLTDKMKRSFFQAAVVSILLYGCTTWTLTKRLERRLDGNYTRMLRAVLNKSWRQHPTRLQLYGHLPPITKTIQVRRTRHAGHCWRSKDELISDVLLWTPTHGCARVGRPARTYIQQLCEDTGCNPEDLPEAMNDREKWRETVRDIRAGGATWWWWWYGNTLNNLVFLVMSLNCISWSVLKFEGWGVLLHNHYSQIHSSNISVKLHHESKNGFMNISLHESVFQKFQVFQK